MRKKSFSFIVLVVLLLVQLTVNAFVPIEDDNQPDIVNFYGAVLRNAAVNDEKEGGMSTYSLYDFDKDGIIELIVDDNKPHNFRNISFYKFNNGLVHMGNYAPGYAELCEYPNGAGLIEYYALRNSQRVELLAYEQSSFIEKGVIYGPEIIESGAAYSEPQDLIDGAYKLEKYPVNDDSYLKKLFSKEISVYINGKKVEFDQPPVMAEGGRVMVPIRPIAERMGGTVKWSDKMQSALIIYADRMVVFKNYNNSAIVAKEPEINKWEKYYCDVPPMIVGERTLTPVRAIGECLGAVVDWDEKSYTVTIDTPMNTEQAITDEAVIKFNIYNSLFLDDNKFYLFSPEIDEFYNSRNTWTDAFILWWDDWFLGVDNILSKETNTEYMVKKCLVDIFAELSADKIINIDSAVEINNWLSTGMSFMSYIDFAEVGKSVDLSVGTANVLSQLGNALDKAGLKIELTGAAFETISKMLSDYTNSITYIETMKESLDSSSSEDVVFINILDDLKNEYTNKFVSALSDGAKEGRIIVGSYLIGEVTGGAFTLASFAKDTLNFAAGINDKAEAVRNIHCIYWFNDKLDSMEINLIHDLFTIQDGIDEYAAIFEVQKIVKKKMYEAMNQLKDNNDEYTKKRIQEQLNKIESMSYIVWE